MNDHADKKHETPLEFPEISIEECLRDLRYEESVKKKIIEINDKVAELWKLAIDEKGESYIKYTNEIETLVRRSLEIFQKGVLKQNGIDIKDACAKDNDPKFVKKDGSTMPYTNGMTRTHIIVEAVKEYEQNYEDQFKSMKRFLADNVEKAIGLNDESNRTPGYLKDIKV